MLRFAVFADRLPIANKGLLEADFNGNSSYQALWLTASKHFAAGLQFNASYTFSKSIDDNSQDNQGLVIQDSYNIRGDRGLSDFDARHRFVLNGIYNLPFKGNRFIEGWQLSLSTPCKPAVPSISASRIPRSPVQPYCGQTSPDRCKPALLQPPMEARRTSPTFKTPGCQARPPMPSSFKAARRVSPSASGIWVGTRLPGRASRLWTSPLSRTRGSLNTPMFNSDSTLLTSSTRPISTTRVCRLPLARQPLALSRRELAFRRAISDRRGNSNSR